MRHRFESRLTRGTAPDGTIPAAANRNDEATHSPAADGRSGVWTTTFGDAAEARWADDGGPTLHVRPRKAPLIGILGPLDTLYARYDAMAEGRTPGDSTAVHNAILERLAANRLAAETRGWTSCALHRVAGMGTLRLWGIPPAGGARAVVPDWVVRRDVA